MRTYYNGLFDLVDSIFDFTPSTLTRGMYSYPYGYKLKNTDDGQIFTLDLPGQSKEDVKVTYKDDDRELRIEATDYSRSWTLPKHTVISDAEMKDGRLTLTLKEDLPPEKEVKLIELK